jgi:hypothetical protein
MPNADQTNTTPIVSVSTSSGDLALIRACNRLTAVENAQAAIFASPIADDAAEYAAGRLERGNRALRRRVRQLGRPTTAAGALTLGRAAVAVADKMLDGTCIASDFSHYLAFAALQFPASEGPALAANAADPATLEAVQTIIWERGGRYLAGVLDSAGVGSIFELPAAVIAHISERAALRAAKLAEIGARDATGG